MGEKILIVDDDPGVRKTLSKLLSRGGYDVDSVEDGASLFDPLKNSKIDLILLDVMLPGEDGFNLAISIRKVSNVPIIFITGRVEEVDKVIGLEIGGDDYITKPFQSRELIARVRSTLRRSKLAADIQVSGAQVFKFNGWTLNPNTFEITSPDEKNVPVTSYEYSILALFLNNPERIMSKSVILDEIAHREWNPDDRAVEFAIMNLRRKLGDKASKPKFIKTLRNEGYKFIANVNPHS